MQSQVDVSHPHTCPTQIRLRAISSISTIYVTTKSSSYSPFWIRISPGLRFFCPFAALPSAFVFFPPMPSNDTLLEEAVVDDVVGALPGDWTAPPASPSLAAEASASALALASASLFFLRASMMMIMIGAWCRRVVGVVGVTWCWCWWYGMIDCCCCCGGGYLVCVWLAEMTLLRSK